MKLFQKISAIVFLVLIMTVSAAACSDDNADSASKGVSDLVGTWKMVFDEDKFDEVFISEPEEQKVQSKALMSVNQMKYEFKADGTVVCRMTSLMGGDENAVESKWTREGDTIKVEAASTEMSSGTFSVQENTMKLEGNKLIPISDDPSLKVIHYEKE